MVRYSAARVALRWQAEGGVAGCLRWARWGCLVLLILAGLSLFPPVGRRADVGHLANCQGDLGHGYSSHDLRSQIRSAGMLSHRVW